MDFAGEGSGDALGFLINILAMAMVLIMMAVSAFIYIDILSVKAETKEQLLKIDRLRKQIEQQAKKEDAN